ncbi:hypothetical protein PG984_011572 [Apiospora sp. TS-2023a]
MSTPPHPSNPLTPFNSDTNNFPPNRLLPRRIIIPQPPSVTTLQAQANRCETQDSDLLASEELQTIQVALSGGRRHRRGNLSQTELETFHMFRRDVRSGSIPSL